MGRAVGGNVAIETRLRAAQGLNAFDAHALAGFLDAEGSFGISGNNGGRNWQCAMTVAVRLDDGDVLADLCRSSGLGRLSSKRPRRGSRAQMVWSIASKAECVALVRLLRRFPLRARKRRDFEIWSKAVDRWAASPYETRRDRSFHPDMAEAVDRLRNVRRYVNLPPPALDGSTDDLLTYFGGYFSGEGCFTLSSLAPRAVVRVRQDDRAILDLFADRFRLGLVREHSAYQNPNPSVTWQVCATDDLAPAVKLFEAAELRGRKRREFEVWREAAHERAFAKIGGRRWDRARVEGVAKRLKALRAYRPPPDVERGRAPTRGAYGISGGAAGIRRRRARGHAHSDCLHPRTRGPPGVADSRHDRSRVWRLGARAGGGWPRFACQRASACRCS
jgi:hypothetical protein